MQNVSSGRINSYYASMDDLQYVVSCDVWRSDWCIMFLVGFNSNTYRLLSK
jgi:hypothetical protein